MAGKLLKYQNTPSAFPFLNGFFLCLSVVYWELMMGYISMTPLFQTVRVSKHKLSTNYFIILHPSELVKTTSKGYSQGDIFQYCFAHFDRCC